ncbi:MAG: alanine racemase [Thermacetogeniaceae bacterium]
MDNEQAGQARWVEIDLDAIAGNVAAVKRLLDPGVKLLAVVKADGYGHGLVPVARIAIMRGADMLGVTHPEDGVRLRQAGIAAPVLVFRPLLPGEEEAIVEWDLTPSVSSLAQAQRLSAAAAQSGRQMPVHLEIETGMGRTGFTPETLLSVLDKLLNLPGILLDGIYTHFAAAAGDTSFTRRQYRLFDHLEQEIQRRGVHIPLRHVCNSAATLLYPELHLEMVRVGNLLYGQLPAGIRDGSLPDGLQLKDPWSFWTRVVHLKPVQRGGTVGYGRTRRLRRDTVLAVLPVGYSEGFGLDVAPHPAGWIDLLKVLVKTAGSFLGLPLGIQHVSINGRTAPVLGRISMELSCVDVGKIPGVGVGTPVRLPGRRTTIRASVPRVYITSDAAEDTIDPNRNCLSEASPE